MTQHARYPKAKATVLPSRATLSRVEDSVAHTLPTCTGLCIMTLSTTHPPTPYSQIRDMLTITTAFRRLLAPVTQAHPHKGYQLISRIKAVASWWVLQGGRFATRKKVSPTATPLRTRLHKLVPSVDGEAEIRALENIAAVHNDRFYRRQLSGHLGHNETVVCSKFDPRTDHTRLIRSTSTFLRAVLQTTQWPVATLPGTLPQRTRSGPLLGMQRSWITHDARGETRLSS